MMEYQRQKRAVVPRGEMPRPFAANELPRGGTVYNPTQSLGFPSRLSHPQTLQKKTAAPDGARRGGKFEIGKIGGSSYQHADPAASVSDELREIAHNVRAIGRGRGANPESVLLDKERAAERLLDLAGRIGR